MLSKKIISLFFLFLIVTLTPIKICFSDNIIEILAPSAILIEESTGKVLFEKNSHEKRSCASITKIMTMILVMEAIDSKKISLSDMVIASEHASSMGGSDIWLESGEAMTVDELIKAVLVASANDAAVALAEHIYGSEEKFVDKMNEKAKKLSMNDTTFKNCNGLDEEGHFSSAYDISIMSKELMKHKEIFSYTSIWIDYLRDGKTQLVNTNKLLKSYKGITGLKTGTTSEAGCCISATAKRDDLSLIAVVLGDKVGKDRFKDASDLLDYGFSNYSMLKPVLDEKNFTPINIINGMKNSIDIKVKYIDKILVKKGEEKLINSSIEIDSSYEAPIDEEKVLGYLVYRSNNDEVARFPVVPSESVPKMNFSLILKKMIKLLFKV